MFNDLKKLKEDQVATFNVEYADDKKYRMVEIEINKYFSGGGDFRFLT